MEILLVLGGRSQTLRCANFLSAAGHRAAVTDTPVRLVGSCTLSVRTDIDGLTYFKANAYAFSSFAAAYVDYGDGKYTRIL